MAAEREAESHDMRLKLLMVGDTGVGKSCMLLRYSNDSFSPMFITTIGIDFKIKHVDIAGQRVKLQIWDTAGQERFHTITTSYFKGAHGIVLVYDVTDRDTFESISGWLRQIKEEAGEEVNVVLVGNKSDMDAQRVVSMDEGRALGEQYSMQFFETSAKNNVMIDECFLAIASETKARLEKAGYTPNPRPAEPTTGAGNVRLNSAASKQVKEGRKCC